MVNGMMENTKVLWKDGKYKNGKWYGMMENNMMKNAQDIKMIVSMAKG